MADHQEEEWTPEGEVALDTEFESDTVAPTIQTNRNEFIRGTAEAEEDPGQVMRAVRDVQEVAFDYMQQAVSNAITRGKPTPFLIDFKKSPYVAFESDFNVKVFPTSAVKGEKTIVETKGRFAGKIRACHKALEMLQGLMDQEAEGT